MGSKNINRVDRHDAIGSPAIGNDFTISRELCQALFQLRNRNGNSARDMPCPVFFIRANIQNSHSAATDAFQQLLSIHRLHGVALIVVFASDPLNFSKARFRQTPKGPEEIANFIVRKPVLDEHTLVFSLQKVYPAQYLEVMRCVGNRMPDLSGKGLNSSRALTDNVQQFESKWAGKSFPYATKLLVYGVFVLSGGCLHYYIQTNI